MWFLVWMRFGFVCQLQFASFQFHMMLVQILFCFIIMLATGQVTGKCGWLVTPTTPVQHTYPLHAPRHFIAFDFIFYISMYVVWIIYLLSIFFSSVICRFGSDFRQIRTRKGFSFHFPLDGLIYFFPLISRYSLSNAFYLHLLNFCSICIVFLCKWWLQLLLHRRFYGLIWNSFCNCSSWAILSLQLLFGCKVYGSPASRILPCPSTSRKLAHCICKFCTKKGKNHEHMASGQHPYKGFY